MEVLKFGWKYWKKNLKSVIVTTLMSLTALFMDLLLPMVTALFINYVIQSNDPSAETSLFSFMLSGKYGGVHTMELFWNLAILFLTLLLVKLVLTYVKNVWNQKLGLRLETDLRMATFRKLLDLDSATISNYNTGELLTTINWDTIMFKEMFCRIIPNMIDSAFVLVTSIVILASINPVLLVIPVIMIPFFIVSLIRFKKLARVNFQNIRGCNSDMNLTVQENIEAVRLVRSFTNEEVEKKKFDDSNERLKNSYIRQVKLSATFEAVFNSIKQFAYIGSIAVSALLVMNGHIMVGYLVACADYVLRIMNYINMINNMMFQMQQQIVSGYKMIRFMECETRIPEGTKTVQNSGKPHIQIKDASLELDGKTILKNINLDIPHGKKVGIVGGTGSGKSTLLESLIRIQDMSSGGIYMDGVNLKEYKLDSVRDQFAYVFQDVFLFSNTVDSNISYSDPTCTEEDVRKAAKDAQADDFIQKLEDGYETIIGERGLGISGGQKQRVSIARALLKNAPVLIFDDSTSALDVNTEKKLLQQIRTSYADKTLLISAHRMSSVVDCDEIIYLLNGEIAERGTFEELMALDGHFASVYKIQEAQKNSVIDYDNIANGE